MRLGHGLAEHALAGLARLAGRRYFDVRHFDRVYRTPDPWDYATSDYEAARREALLAALPRPRYVAALEVGCGEGYTTRLLAGRAERVVGLDLSDAALARAGGLPANVTVVQGDLLGARLPLAAPRGGFDLVVCAEMLYYCYRLPFGAACCLARDRLVRWLAPGGDLVLMHPHHYPTHSPFDRLAGGRLDARRRGLARWGLGRDHKEALLVRVARRRIALAPRPVTVAVYRRRDGPPAVDGSAGMRSALRGAMEA